MFWNNDDTVARLDRIEAGIEEIKEGIKEIKEQNERHNREIIRLLRIIADAVAKDRAP